jgi:hypothetical protein
MADDVTMDEILGPEPTEENIEQEAPQPEPEAPPEVPEGEQAVDADVTQKFVPLPALHEARKEIAQLKEQLGTVNQLRNELEQFRGQYYQQRQQQPPAGQQMPQIPDFDADPIGHLQAKIELQQNVLSQVLGVETQRQQQTIQQNQEAQLAEHVAVKVDEFKAVTPDYMDAYKFVRDVRIRELQAIGVTDPMQIEKQLQHGASMLAITAIQNRKNPGEALYSLAKSYGYQPKGAAGDLNTVNQGMKQASGSIGKGGATTTDPTFDALLNAGQDDFQKMWNKIFNKQINR